MTLTDQVSVPLADLLPPLLKFSNNGHAELLVKAMGRVAAPDVPGSWTTGLPAASAALAGLGVDTATLTLGDGSGLSRRNWVTARHLTTLLAAARTRPWFPAFQAALPVAGHPDPQVGGTLRNRMVGTVAAGAVRAKTGSLAGVNTLSGYATGPDGRELIFAALSNGATATVSDVLDGVAVMIAGGRTT